MTEPLPPLFLQLQECLTAHPPAEVHFPGFELRESAVLVPFFMREGVPFLLFTERPTTLRQHPGQISFPGGARDASDESPLQTALRETDEELGIPRHQVVVLGALDEFPTPTGFRIRPFVGVIPDDLQLSPNPEEVAQVLSFPLSALMDPRRHRTEPRRVPFSKEPIQVDFYEVDGHVIWGATGRILRELLDGTYGLPAWDALRSGTQP